MIYGILKLKISYYLFSFIVQSYMHMVEKILNNTTTYGKIRASHEGLLHSSTLSRKSDIYQKSWGFFTILSMICKIVNPYLIMLTQYFLYIISVKKDMGVLSYRSDFLEIYIGYNDLVLCFVIIIIQFGWLVVFYVPSTTRSFPVPCKGCEAR